MVERKPPAMGETGVLEKAAEELSDRMAVGSVMLVEAVRQISNVEETQTALSLTLVGFASAFELVILCWSAARKGVTEVVVAGVVDSFAYNVTMTLGAVIRPLSIVDATLLQKPSIAMLLALVLVILLAIPKQRISRKAGWLLVVAYPVFLLGSR
ncbi:hypothetical protein NIES593_15060 [Hydrococcus rivularis NIES-593]|uniref:Sodium/calcium exchanger membrane region domain-containing protein n=1 Tax=Hydrococcus rivularis NIES-593 TaxID=1921803 RepID=A0A1U7HDX3_9CYAN|nr:hypothetical protein [Hydrococcus rivularis]OKH21741.1 hypothetical protein NIES593_15060 [Hydrococcus rivularis NIES-593]